MHLKNLIKASVATILAVGTLASCTIDEHHVIQPGDKNIKSIEVVESSIPTSPIKVGKFDEAGIKYTITYADDTKLENQPVTSSMVPEAYQHYLMEPGEVTLKIAFRGTNETPVTTSVTVEFDLYHLKYMTWTGMNGDEKVYTLYKQINYAQVSELANYKNPTGRDTTVEGKFHKWDHWDTDKSTITTPVDKEILPIYEETHPTSISVNDSTVPVEGIKFDKFNDAGITMTVTYSDLTTNPSVPVTQDLLTDTTELTASGTDGEHSFTVSYYEGALTDSFNLTTKSYDLKYYALTSASTSISDQKVVKSETFRTAPGDITGNYPSITTPIEIGGVTKKHSGWDVSSVTTLVDTAVHATYEDTNYYSVNFYKGDSTLISTQLVASGGNATEPSAADRAMTNYTFYAWDRSYQNITANTNVYGIYYEIEQSIEGYTKVTFNSNNDKALFYCFTKHNELIAEPVDPTKEGFEFKGWFTDDGTFNTQWDFEEDTVTGTALTLYAKWGAHTHNYNQQVATAEHLASAATCEAKATYYYSCSCGENGTETFEYGDFESHSMTHYAAVAPTCVTDGNYEYWHCSTCNKNYSDEAGTNIIADVVIPRTGHSYNGSICTVCGKQNALKVSGAVGNKATDDPYVLTPNTTDTPANGFAEIYDVDSTANGYPNHFFTSSCSLDSYTLVKFAVKTTSGGIHLTNTNITGWPQYTVTGSDTHSNEWITLTATRESTSSLNWTITNSLGDWTERKSGGVSIGANLNITISDYSNMFRLFLFQTDAVFAISDVQMYSKCVDGNHSYGDLVPVSAATCGTDGAKVAHYHCSECGKYFDENYVEISESEAIEPRLGHDFDASTHVCSRCGYHDWLNEKTVLGSERSITATTEYGLADGYANAYITDAASSNSTTGNICSNTGRVDDMKEVRFAVKVLDSSTFATLTGSYDQGTHWRIGKDGYNNGEWVEIVATRTDTSSEGVWTITNSLGEWNSYGASPSSTITELTVTGKNTVWDIVRVVSNWGNSGTCTSPICISEMLVK